MWEFYFIWEAESRGSRGRESLKEGKTRYMEIKLKR